MKCLSVLFVILLACLKKCSYSLHVYNIDGNDDDADQIEHDCLYYEVLDDIVEYADTDRFSRPHQVIAYCIRPLKRFSHQNNKSLLSNANSTFEALRNNKVGSSALLYHSVPVDIVERYQAYLEIPDDRTANEIVYQCTSQRFGQFCQYELLSRWTFSETVRDIFKNKPTASFETTEITCYTHMVCKRHLLSSICLDWREICDGNIDCTDGIDEQNCAPVESSVCAANEFRCLNGQCIPNELFGDGPLNPDCSDGTDETSAMDPHYYAARCYRDPSFRCEERTRPKGLGFSCGDGQFLNRSFVLLSFKEFCHNRRATLFNRFIFDVKQLDSTYACSVAFNCLHGLRILGARTCNDCSEWFRVEDSCQNYFSPPSKASCFLFTVPIWDVHAYFLYNIRSLSYLPDYICYNASYCNFKHNDGIGEHSCLLMQTSSDIRKSKLAADVLTACASSSQDRNHIDCNHDFAYQCASSSKCIIKYKLADGFQDCPKGDDETTGESCRVFDSHRFRCTSEEKCISPWLVFDGEDHCAGGEDEVIVGEQQLGIPFSRLCDRKINKQSSLLNFPNDTDETNCEQWPCDNRFNLCDREWDCQNGLDEMGCPGSPCGSNAHMCLSASKQERICLPIDKVGDGIIDCLGAYDERHFCRSSHPRNLNSRYFCRARESCMSVYSLCSWSEQSKYYCNDKDYNSFCEHCYANVSDPCIFQDKRPDSKLIYFQLPSGYRKNVIGENLTTPLPAKTTTHSSKTKPDTPFFQSGKQAWFCHRGLLIRAHAENRDRCLCPPSYYGDRCENQNERISLTVKVRRENYHRTWFHIYRFVLVLIDAHERVNSYDHFLYSIKSQCVFNNYLLYMQRPKDKHNNYSVRIDAYLTSNLEFHSSWLLPIPFPFLPVVRLAALLIIPESKPTILTRCSVDCIHGKCTQYVGQSVGYCHCDSGWTGVHCDISFDCQCSPDSLCVGVMRNKSICVCPTHKFGPRCFLQRVGCQSAACKNGGSCMLNDERVSSDGFVCVCPPGYAGVRCELAETEIHLSFDGVPIPSTVLLHHVVTSTHQHPIRRTLFKTIRVYEDTLIYRTSFAFDILFVEFNKRVYLTALTTGNESTHTISAKVTLPYQCRTLNELFNSTLATWPLLRRVKFYHTPCRDDRKLVCIYDGQLMCLCASGKYVDCFEFDRKTIYDCRGSGFCLNGAQCFQDRLDCPAELSCNCPECYYGARCQLTTTSFGHSLDAILGYHILPRVSFAGQPTLVHRSAIAVGSMCALGFLNGILSLLTFKSKTFQAIGCGTYLYVLSVISLLIPVVFLVKFCLLLVSQMAVLAQGTVIFVHCVTVDFFIRILLSTYNWLSGCVAIERTFIVVKGPHFSKQKSKRAARWITGLVFFLFIATSLPEAIFRQVIEEPEDSRTWCAVSYPHELLRSINSALNIIQFIVPFVVNFISAVIILFVTSRPQRDFPANKQKDPSLKKNFQQLKHHFISPCIFIILNVPNLVLNLVSGCMKSSRDPSLFLVSYFVSFAPSTLTFVVFVLPSRDCKNEFLLVMRRCLPKRTQS